MATNHIKCKAPNKLDRFFISKANGGLSPNQRINARDGYVVPNCTGYANGWFSKEDPDELAAKIVDICSDRQNMKRVGQKAGETLYKPWKTAVDNAQKRYREILEEK